jgi:hypothetical protein
MTGEPLTYALVDERAAVEQAARKQVATIRATMAKRQDLPSGLRLPLYPTNSDVCFITGFPGKASFCRAVNEDVAKELAKDGIAVIFVPMRAKDYFAWLGKAPNTQRKRDEYLTRDFKGEVVWS